VQPTAKRLSRFSSGVLPIGSTLLFATAACAASYSSLTIPQGGSVQIGSPSENLFLTMQSDGNLVLYQNGSALWASNTGGECSSGSCFAVFQTDGNFVVYNGSTALWSTNSGGTPGDRLVLSDQPRYVDLIGSVSAGYPSQRVHSIGRSRGGD
jgi:hypothetical protein